MRSLMEVLRPFDVGPTALPNGQADAHQFTAPQAYLSTDVARSYDQTRFAGWRGRLSDALEHRALAKCAAQLPVSSSILEVACGTGRFTAALGRHFAQVTASDISPAMLEIARARTGVKAQFCLADGRQLPFSDESFDIVAAFFLLGHAPVAERRNLLSEFGRVTKKHILLSVPLVDRALPRAKVRVRKQHYPHRNFYPATRSSFEEELGAAGLVGVSWVPVLSGLAVTWFLLARRLAEPIAEVTDDRGRS